MNTPTRVPGVAAPTRRAACAWLACTPLAALAQVRPAIPEDAALDAPAFAPVQELLATRFTDIDSLVVVRRGRIASSFYRDDAPERLRDVQSVEKSALSALVGIALQRGELDGLDTPVLQLQPAWKALNDDPRAARVTLRHLLTMTSGFDAGQGARLPSAQAWRRPFAAPPGDMFRYDNCTVPLLSALLEQVTGMPVADYARRHLVQPLGMAEPLYGRTVHLRTLDMAKLGVLFLQDGRWDGAQLLPADYVHAATEVQNEGGPPVSMPFGFLWWVLPAPAPRRTFLASGYAGQMIWVHPPLELVVAVTSQVTAGSQQRGQAVRLLRSIVPAAQERAAQPLPCGPGRHCR